MAPQTLRRAQGRRRSSCPSFLWLLVIAWAVIMAGSNIAHVLTLPEFFVRTPRREVERKPPNYYEILEVSPLVNESTLKNLRKLYLVEFHPDKIKGSAEATEKFYVVQAAFETLLDGRRRCEYDKQHRIKGHWPVQTCHDAFREEYRQLQRQREDIYREVLQSRQTSGTKKSSPGQSGPEEGEPTSSKVKTEPSIPETGKPSSKKSASKSSRLTSEDRPPAPDTEARLFVPVATVEVDPEKKDTLEIVTSLTSVVTGWLVYSLTKAKVTIAYWSGQVFSLCDDSLGSLWIWLRGG